MCKRGGGGGGGGVILQLHRRYCLTFLLLYPMPFGINKSPLKFCISLYDKKLMTMYVYIVKVITSDLTCNNDVIYATSSRVLQRSNVYLFLC